MLKWFILTPFEKNYGLKHIAYIRRFGWGLYLGIKPKNWFRISWAHPEADVIWYSIGPFEFYTTN